MSIYVDVSAAVHQRAGLGRYTESLTHALVKQRPDAFGLFYNREEGIAPLKTLAHLPTRTIALGYKPWRMLVWMGQLSKTPFNRLLPNAKLFHATEHLLMPLCGIPTILTAHDLIFKHLPEHHKPLNRWYLNLTMPLYCKRAKHIIAVSEATRKDLIETYHLPAQKITVIHEAADPCFHPAHIESIQAVRAHYGLPENYLLYVGTIEPRKNLTALLHVWEELYAKREVPPLVIVGKRGWLSNNFYTALENSPARDAVLLTGYVLNEDLPVIYAGATALVFPSLYEGFGLPPLEAMACGTPVACANTTSLPEVVGDAALTFDPTDRDALTTALRSISNDRELQTSLSERGLKRAAQFSWKRAAQETLALYDKVMQA